MNTKCPSEYVDALKINRQFSGAILVAKGDNVILCDAFGYANIEHDIPNSISTKFRIGSITKPFTASAILMLEEARLLSTEDHINKFLPNGSSIWSSITIHHLLTHTAGLIHPWDSYDFASTVMVTKSLDQVIDSFRDTPLLCEPGEQYHYGGLAYFMLAKIIEEVSGQTYEHFLQQRVFGPLGMNDTGADDYKKILRNRASGYKYKRGELTNADLIYMPVLTGGGNLYSTITDLHEWNKALNAGQLISRCSFQKMYEIHRNNYGYGWNIGAYQGKLEVRHSGGAPGFSTHILRIPADKTCVIVLCNVVRNHHNPKRVISIANDLRDIVYSSTQAP